MLIFSLVGKGIGKTFVKALVKNLVKHRKVSKYYETNCRFIKLLSLFLLVSVLALKKLNDRKTDPHVFELCKPKDRDFPWFPVFVSSPIPKNKNPEITEIHQKKQNTEIWECNFKDSLNVVQMTSFSKWLSYLANYVPYFCL